MSELETLPESQVLRVIANADSREFSLFLGAGASKSSGVPLASEMIEEWRQMMFEDRAPDGAEFSAWCKEQPWYQKDDEYSHLFETLFPNERARQKFVEPRMEAGFPNWGYLYLANLVSAGYFNVIFTTNFDDLINDALSMYLAYNPVVCSAESEVLTINIATDRAKIIKLHGDYLFKRLKNTSAELAELDPNMESKFKEFSKQCGMLVIGYAGRDKSVMTAIEKTMEDSSAFPVGIWWGLRSNERPGKLVARLAQDHPNRFKLFKCRDFDAFMVGLHSRRQLSLPEAVVAPYESVKNRFSRLIGEVERGKFADETIKQHVHQLQKELNRPWAKADDAAGFDLLEARLAVGKRDFPTALKLVTEYCSQRPDDAEALATWGDALALKAEEEHDSVAGDMAIEKWQEAIRRQPEHLQSRYSLIRYFQRAQNFQDAIGPAEDIVRLAPNDAGNRRNLAQLYAATGRTDDALKLLEEMLGREPNAADLHAMHAGVCEQRGLVARGLKSITRAVELDPERSYYRFAFANGLARMGRADQAEREYLAAISLDARNLSFRLQAAQFFALRQRLDKAILQLREAVSIEPNSAEARGLLAEFLLVTGRVAEAKPQIEGALAISPDDSRLLVNAGIMHLRSGRHSDAEQCWRRSAEINPQQPQPHYWLATLYWILNRDADSHAALNRLHQINPQVAQQTGAELQMLTQQAMSFPGPRQALMENIWAMQAQGGNPSGGSAGPAWFTPGAGPSPEGHGNSVIDDLKSTFKKLLQ